MDNFNDLAVVKILRRNHDLGLLMFDWIAANKIILLRYTKDQNQVFSGDLDIFVNHKSFNKIFKNLIEYSLSKKLQVWSFSTLSGYRIYVTYSDFCGLCTLDLHTREVYKNVILISSEQIKRHTYINKYNILRPSVITQSWLNFCFYFFNKDFQNHKFKLALNTLYHKNFEKIPRYMRFFLHLLLECPWIKYSLIKAILLFFLFFCSMRQPILFYKTNINYFLYILKKLKMKKFEIKLSKFLTSKERELIKMYFRGQPIDFDISTSIHYPCFHYDSLENIQNVDLEELCRNSLYTYLNTKAKKVNELNNHVHIK